jgi:hypothetical protein
MTWLERLKTMEQEPVILKESHSINDLSQLRLTKFTNQGLNLKDAKEVAERLELRDIQKDDRILCYECNHLKGIASSWRCGNWRSAEVGIKESYAGLPIEMVDLLQRCNGFKKEHL